MPHGTCQTLVSSYLQTSRCNILMTLPAQATSNLELQGENPGKSS